VDGGNGSLTGQNQRQASADLATDVISIPHNENLLTWTKKVGIEVSISLLLELTGSSDKVIRQIKMSYWRLKTLRRGPVKLVQVALVT